MSIAFLDNDNWEDFKLESVLQFSCVTCGIEIYVDYLVGIYCALVQHAKLHVLSTDVWLDLKV